VRGLITVLKRYRVGEVWSSGSSYKSGDFTEWLRLIKEKSIPTKNLASPDTLTLGELSVRAIHPPNSVIGKVLSETHDGTLSLLLSYSLRSIILAGDIDQKHEAAIARSCQPPACSLDSDVLQVAHHGSASGTSAAFLKVATPLVALIPVGEGNKFKHPRAEVLERLLQAKATTFRTDQDGRIGILVTNEYLDITTTAGEEATFAQTPQPAPT
jgi:competence protein ComEC